MTKKKILDKTTELDKRCPLGSEALKPIIDNQTEKKLWEEQKTTALKKILDDLSSGKDFEPVMMGKVDGEIVVFKLQKKDGIYVIPEVHTPDKKILNKKKKVIKKIMAKIHKTLRKDIGEVSEMALMRKGIDELKELVGELKDNKKCRLVNRVGCIFLEVGDVTLQI